MLLASWFGAGLLPYAPGTWGALAALPCGWVIAWFGGPAALTGGAILVFVVGCLVSGPAAQALGAEGPGMDRHRRGNGDLGVAGAAGFLGRAARLARLYGSLRILPHLRHPEAVAGAPDRTARPGGPGIMLDDLVASVYALPPLALLISEGIIVVRP